MPKPTASGSLVTSRIALTSGATPSETRRSFAGDAGSRNQIDEAGGILRDQFQARCGAGGRGQKHRIEPALAASRAM